MPDETKTAGATPAVSGATPDQTAAAGAAGTQPATGATGAGDDALGEAGKRALQAEREARKAAEDARKAAERELETLRAATQTDQEKALAAARKEGATEATQKAEAKVRRSEVRRALASAGCSDVELAAIAPDFASLAVTDDGEVDGLAKAIEAFKGAHGSLFGTRSVGSPDAGTGGRSAAAATFTRQQIRDPQFYAAHKSEIEAAAKAGRITG